MLLNRQCWLIFAPWPSVYWGLQGFSDIANQLAKIIGSVMCVFSKNTWKFLLKAARQTNIANYGAVVVSARAGTDYCPVPMIEQCMHLANISSSTNPSESYLFRWLIATKNGQKLRDSANISYTRARKLVLAIVESIGLDRKQFSLHSLRFGGVSAAANAGVPDWCFKHHGRWLSESAKDGYIQDKLEERLSVSKKSRPVKIIQVHEPLSLILTLLLPYPIMNILWNNAWRA